MWARTVILFASGATGGIDVYLVDTDVISEARKGQKANPGVREFFVTAGREAIPLYLSVVTVGELRQGVAWATRSVLTALAGRIPDNVYNKDVIPRWKERFGGASISN